MTVYPIVLEEREFPSDRVLNTRNEMFEPEVSESRDSEGRVFWRRVEPYRLSVRPFITEFDVGLSPPPPPGPGSPRPIPAPWGPGEPEIRIYTNLFTIWHGDWTRDRSRFFHTPFPLHFISYYVSADFGVEADTVQTHAVSLRNLRVLDVSPVSGDRDGVVSTAERERRVEAVTPLRGAEAAAEGIGGAHFSEWAAWTVPAADIEPPRTFAEGLTTIERRMTLEPNTVGRAVAFYKPFPEPPRRDGELVEPPRLELPFDERIRRVIERGDLAAVRSTLQELDGRLGRLKQIQEQLKGHLKAKR